MPLPCMNLYTPFMYHLPAVYSCLFIKALVNDFSRSQTVRLPPSAKFGARARVRRAESSRDPSLGLTPGMSSGKRKHATP